VGLIGNMGIGGLFLLWQKPYFEQGKVANWAPAKAGEAYRPSRLGLLVLVGLGCLAAEVAAIVLLVLAGGLG
jgi:hypothetical protein